MAEKNDVSGAVCFKACFPGTNSDIKFGPDGARIILDIPKMYEGAAAQLLRYREMVLDVSISEAPRVLPIRREYEDEQSAE